MPRYYFVSRYNNGCYRRHIVTAVNEKEARLAVLRGFVKRKERCEKIELEKIVHE